MIRTVSAATLLIALTLGGCAQSGRHPPGATPATPPAPPRPGAMFGPQVAVFDGHELWVDYVCEDDSRVMVRFLGHWADAVTPDGIFHRLTRKSDAVIYQGEGYDLRGPGLSINWTTPSGRTHCKGGV